MGEHPIKVFFDASSFITVGAPPGNVAFQRLVDLVNHGFISVVTTDLTIKEVINHHTRETFNVLRPLATPRFQRLAARHFGIEFPSLTNAMTRDHIRRDIADGVEGMIQSLGARILDINVVSPSVIFEAYAQNEGLFIAQNKKNQFPDAFIFECLKTVASADRPLLIVAADTDFDGPAQREDNIDLIKSVSGLFEKLGLKQDEPDYELESFLRHELMENNEFLAYVEFQDDYMDGYRVTASCHTIELDSISAFQQVDEGAPLLLSVDATIELDLEIDPNDGGQSEHETGSGRVSFYASIENDENGELKTISELRVFKFSLSWGYEWF